MNDVLEHLLMAVTHAVGALKHISATGTVQGVETAVAAADLRLTAAMVAHQKAKDASVDADLEKDVSAETSVGGGAPGGELQYAAPGPSEEHQ